MERLIISWLYSLREMIKIVSLHADETEKHVPCVACNVGWGKQDSASEPI